MRILAFTHEDQTSWGVRDGARILDVGRSPRVDEHSFVSAIRSSPLSELVARANEDPRWLSTSEITPALPLGSDSKVLCVGLNYADHIAEMSRPTPEKPVMFTRFPDSFVAARQPLVRPRASERFDFEGELAVVISRAGRALDPAHAMEHVLGFTNLNDGSIRDFQNHTHQFAPGKNFPGSGSIGPEIVTPDELGPLPGRAIRTRVNGAVMQESSLDQLVFGVADLVSYCSTWTTLRPGDVIATGTPGGVGAGRNPQVWLTPGDECVVEVDGIPPLANPIVAEA